MKLRSQYEGLAIRLIFAAALAKDTLVALTGNLTVDKAGANASVIGRVTVGTKAANQEGTVETYFKERVEIKAAGAVAAGDYVKMAAPDGTTLENRVAVWVDGTDSVLRRVGLCIKGGADAATLEVLLG